VAQSHSNPMRSVSGKAQFAARARTAPDSEIWFTIGQAWTYHEDGESGYAVRLTMTPTRWDGELLLVPIPEQGADRNKTED
jgi:hypothetical protein